MSRPDSYRLPPLCVVWLARPVPMFQPVFANYMIERRDLPLLQHGGAAMLFESADHHAAYAREHDNHSRVVQHVTRARVSQRLM